MARVFELAGHHLSEHHPDRIATEASTALPLAARRRHQEVDANDIC